MNPTRFRAGLVGAGAISEFHIRAIRAVPGLVELVGLADIDRERATTTGERFGVPVYGSLEELVAAGANVIHVLTPPTAHAAVAIQAMELGCHVLIEKPMAEDRDDCERIAKVARRTGRVATVDHSLLYDPQVMRAFGIVQSGGLGQVVSVDILRSSEYPPYQGGPLPPHYRAAGYPFRDLGVHCLYLLQALLGPIEHVEAEWRSLGGDPNLAYDEWRALVRCRKGLGQFQLSWNVKPVQSQMIIQGTRGVLRVDLFAMLHARRKPLPLPKAAERVVNAVTDSVEPLVDLPVGVWKFARKEVQPFQGLRNLVGDFYRRLIAGEPPPVPLEDGAMVVGWTETVARAAEKEHARRLGEFNLSESVPYLVTGASGSLGSAAVRRLAAEGKRVRAFVRRIPEEPLDGVEYAFGNLGDPEAVERAVRGAETVIHAGAAMRGSWPEHYGSTVVGTRNVIESCKRHGVKLLVHVSSMSVMDWAGSSGGLVSEQTALEPRSQERGAYTRAKLEAERLVSQAVAREDLPAVILRPGQIFGGNIPLVNGAVAHRAGGRWVVLGDGELELPLVYIDDLVDAVVLAARDSLRCGEVIQIVDRERLNQKEVLARVDVTNVIRVPRPLIFALGKLSEPIFGILGKRSPLTLYRLKSALARLRFESDRAEKLLGWRPRVGIREGIRRERERGGGAVDAPTRPIARVSPQRAATAKPRMAHGHDVEAPCGDGLAVTGSRPPG